MNKNHPYSIVTFLIFLIISLPVCLAADTENYQYDANGNLITGDGYYREYDGFNQLVTMRNGSNSSSPIVEQYFYDADGQRMLAIQNNSGSITKIYTPSKEVMRIVNSSGTFDYRYVYAGDKLIARLNPDSSKYFYHGDAEGSTDLITDDSGLGVETTKYDSWGNIDGTGGTKEKKLYTGQFKDNTNQYYYGARYYKPEIGQFISPDDLISDVYDAQMLNRYSYAKNSPYVYKDDDGHMPVLVFGSVAVGILTATYYWTTTPIDYENPDWGGRLARGLEHGVNAGVTTFLAGTGDYRVSGGVTRAAAGNIIKRVGISATAAYSSNVYDALIDKKKISASDIAIDTAISIATSGKVNNGGQFISNNLVSKQSLSFAANEVANTVVASFIKQNLGLTKNSVQSASIRYTGNNADVIKALTSPRVSAKGKYKG